MPFIKMPGVTGKVYVPEINKAQPKKHPCKDCFSCQMCSDDRCQLCRGGKKHGCCKNADKSLPEEG